MVWYANSAVNASGLDSAEIKSVYKEYQTALTLSNELVIVLIDYRGPYTDCWPQREWTGSLASIESRPTPANETSSDGPQVAASADLRALISPRRPAFSEPALPVANQIQRTDPE